MNCTQISFTRHAFERMFEREISPEAVKNVAVAGEVIASYPDDQPYPSALLLGFVNTQPIHIVIAQDESTQACIIVTVYLPDPVLWDDSFKRRRPT